MSRFSACTLIALLSLAGTADAARGPARAADIDDFEDRDLIAASGSAWIPLGDDLLGRKTTLHLETTRGGSDGSKGALRLTGTIGDEPNAFGGAWTPVVEGGRAADLSRFSGLRLRLRGAGEVQVGVRRGSLARAVNFMARVTAGNDWSTVEIPFSRLHPQGAGEPPTSRALIPDDAAPLRALPWRELARDGEGDGRTGLPDARALFVATDRARSLAWFRIDRQETPPATWIGVNLALDADGDPANGPAWWGKNTAFHFDRLVTAWVFRVGDRYEGTVGIASGDEVTAMQLTNQEEVRLAVDRALKRVYVGVPGALIDAGGTRVVAAVGSAFVYSDDLPNDGAALLDPATGQVEPADPRRPKRVI